MERRKFMAATCSTPSDGGVGMPPRPQVQDQRSGSAIFTTLAVRRQICGPEHLGAWAKKVSIPQLKEFRRSELVPARSGGQHRYAGERGGDLELPRRVVKKMFLAHSIEFADPAPALGGEDQGIKQFYDLRGKRRRDHAGTTGQVFLDNALRENKLAPTEIEMQSCRAGGRHAFITARSPPVVLCASTSRCARRFRNKDARCRAYDQARRS